MEIRPYRNTDQQAAADFDRRLKEHDPKLKFLTPQVAWDEVPSTPREYFQIVAADGEELRGGYCVRNDPYWLAGERHDLHHFGYPVSEGVIAKPYAMVGVMLQQDIQRRFRFPYAIGGGSLQSRVNALRVRGGWNGRLVPFFFRVENAHKFLHEIPALRASKTRAVAANLLSMTGLGSVAINLAQFFRSSKRRLLKSSSHYEIVDNLQDIADTLDLETRQHYPLQAIRDAYCISKMFPQEMAGISRALVSHGGRRVGWFVTVNGVANRTNHFGNLKVGLIGDFLAPPEHAERVLSAAVKHLQGLDVDLIVCNASHVTWTKSLRRLGFWSGPSNFPMLTAPKLTKHIAPLGDSLSSFHLTRGDGDGLSLFIPKACSSQLPKNATS